MTKNTPQNRKSNKPSVVVVGVDGSAGAKAALRWALGEARLRQVPLRAVHAWMSSYIAGAVEGYPYWAGSDRRLHIARDMQDVHRAAEELLGRAIADVGSEIEGIEIEHQVVEGPAAEVLVQAASPRDLLVVGSRGHGGFIGLLLGSVSQQCVHHAPCPVVVVHPPTPTAAARESAAAAREESAPAA